MTNEKTSTIILENKLEKNQFFKLFKFVKTSNQIFSITKTNW